MTRHLRLFFVLAALAAFAAPAASQPTTYAPARARTHGSDLARALTGPSNAAPTAIVAQYLRDQGLDVPESSLVQAGSPVAVRDGIVMIRLEQRVAGLQLYGAYAKASFSAHGELVYLIENFASALPSSLTGPRVSAAQGLEVALQRLYPGQSIAVGASRASGNTVEFARTPFFHAGPKVTRVAVQNPDGSIRSGLLVETWREEGNLLHHTLLGSGGEVLFVESRTASDSYNVFAYSPRETLQAVAAGPGAGNAQSPIGWLTGAQTSINITGNNVHGYLDAARTYNVPDSGGVSVTTGDFLTSANLTESPSTASNREVSVQNLFYHNNLIHDILYTHGFTEAAGNFQENNFNKGGQGSDSVNAEAQDGNGTNNANFATPTDGSNPRMQVYLWDGADKFQVLVNSPISDTYGAAGAEFGGRLREPLTGNVVLGNDGSTVDSAGGNTGSVTDGCQPLTNSVSGQIVLVDRGGCNFVVKAETAQAAGAIGVIVANNVGETDVVPMGGRSTARIPALMISQNDGLELRGLANPNVTMRKNPNTLMIDGALDADLIYHEYGHGLTWRMIEGMSGPIAGALGEGASDVLAMFINGDDRIAEYSFSNSFGIRRAPYANYPNTYADVTGDSVHNDGEIYAAIMWKFKELSGLSTSVLLDYFVGAMTLIPATPSYEDMRSGLLAITPNDQDCNVWRAFAQYGVGVGSSAVVSRRGTVTVTESFTKPPACTP